jgi:hypothetical protein
VWGVLHASIIRLCDTQQFNQILVLPLLLLMMLLFQAESCLNKTRAGEATCQKAPYCFWHPENKVCMRNTLQFEADFDKQVERLYVSNHMVSCSTEFTLHCFDLTLHCTALHCTALHCTVFDKPSTH